MCIASSCLWLANVPRHVSPPKLRQLCEMFGSVQSLDFPPCLNMDEALVTFATIGSANSIDRAYLADCLKDHSFCAGPLLCDLALQPSCCWRFACL